MLKRWADWPSGIRWLAGVAAVVLAAAIMWALFVPLADWLARHDVSSAAGALHETALDNARGRLLTLGAGLVAGGALVFTALNFNLLRRNSEQTDQWQRRTYELTAQGQITDRYTKAVEQLGSDKLDVRIGGIYALERVARDSDIDHPTVMQVLTAFIREHSREPWPRSDAGQPVQEGSTRPDVQAAATVISRRDAARDILAVDLTGAVLTGANLEGARLAGAVVTGANLTGAALTGANLTEAVLIGARLSSELTDAVLIGANLTGADLTTANLTSAKLYGADLTDADLTGASLAAASLYNADLTDTRLTSTDLTGADLTGAKLTSADLTGARLTGAALVHAVLTGAVLADADLTDANLADAILISANLTGAALVRADLTGARLTGGDRPGARLTDANLTDVRWPEGVPVPEGWVADSDSGRLKPRRG